MESPIPRFSEIEWNETWIDLKDGFTNTSGNYSLPWNFTQFNGSVKYNGTYLPTISEDKLFTAGIGIYLTFSCMAIIVSLLVLRLIYKKGAKRSHFDALVFSLITANIFCSVAFLVENSIYLHMEIHPGNVSDKIILVAYQTYVFLITVSLLHVLVITSNQLLAVLYPLRFRQILTKRRIKWEIFASWFLSIPVVLMSNLSADDMNEQRIMAAFMLAFGSLLITMYSVLLGKIFFLLKKKNFKRNKEHRIFVNSIAVTLTFITCIFPFAIKSVKATEFSSSEYFLSSFIAVKLFMDPVFYFLVSFWRAKRDEIKREKVMRDRQVNSANLTDGSSQDTRL